MYCPGGTSAERGPLVVTGKASGASAAAAAAVAQYRRYVEGQTRCWSPRPAGSSRSCRPGTCEGAKAAYADARVPYERIEPVAESFGDLDPAIDARAGDVPKAKWTGFHPIEQFLWVRGKTGPETLRTKLMDDVVDLQRRVQTIELEPAQVANGAVELLGEVSKSKITGEEERYSHIDLVDFEANVEGAKAAFDSVRDLVEAAAARAREGDRRALRGRRVGARAIPCGQRLRLVHGADEGRHTRPEPVDRRARGAALRGGGDRRRGADERRGSHGGGCWRPARSVPASRSGASASSGWPPAATATTPQSRSRSTASARPGSRRRRRTACTSPRSTSSPTSKSELRDLLRAWTEAAARMTAGRARRRRRTTTRAPPIDTGEAVGLLDRAADGHLRLRPDAVRRAASASAVAAGGARRSCPRSPATRSTRSAPAATSASRPARTTRRSPSTPSATSPGSAAAPS